MRRCLGSTVRASGCLCKESVIHLTPLITTRHHGKDMALLICRMGVENLLPGARGYELRWSALQYLPDVTRGLLAVSA